MSKNLNHGKKSNWNTKKLATLAMLAALSYLVMVVGRIPSGFLPFLNLKYDPKDVLIVIGGFIYGPLSAALVSLVVSLLEMFSVSETGYIGLIMNVLSTCTFACTASFIYKKRHTRAGAAIGLAVAILLTTGVMILWNYLIVPIYNPNINRAAVVPFLIPGFLPFNLIKWSINAAISFLIYKPIVTSLRLAGLLPPPAEEEKKGKLGIGTFLIAGLVIITYVLILLVKKGIL